MHVLRNRLKIFSTLFLLVSAMGTFGFMRLENLSFIESLYYNIVTMSTVGYGDIHPTNQASRLLALLLIVLGGATFLGVIANATEMIILKRETQGRARKVNMVLGIFFSEVGYKLLQFFSSHDQNINAIRNDIAVNTDWTENRFTTAQKVVLEHKFKVKVKWPFDLEELVAFLNKRREFLLGLLENPVLLEHEDFSELLLAVFHLLEELSSRDKLASLPDSDIMHLSGDMNRVYKKLVEHWLFYLEHLEGHYPYLFSLAVRKNPFNPEATTIVSG